MDGQSARVPESRDLASEIQVPDAPSQSEDLVEPSGGPPRNVPRHGPGFLGASPEVQRQVRRLHHNLGHPDVQRFTKFLRERQAEPTVIQAALDFQCDSCLEAQRDMPLLGQPQFMMTSNLTLLLAWTL